MSTSSYNLEAEDVQTFLNRLEYIFDTSNSIDGTIELECRIWQYKYFNTQTLFNPNQATQYESKKSLYYSVDNDFWNHSKRRLMSQVNSNDIDQTIDIVYKNGDVRKITLYNINNQPLQTIYEVKKNKIKPPNEPIEIITEYSNDRYVITPIRIGISEEKLISEQDVFNYTSSSNFVKERKRTRTSFYFPSKKDPKYRIDFTDCIYESTHKREFQIEIEYVMFKTILQSSTKKELNVIYKNFIPIFFQSLKHIYPQIQSFSTLNNYSSITNCIPSRGLAPINIQNSHIKGGCYDMWVTNKLDGIAYSLFIHIYTTYSTNRQKCLLFLRNDKDLWIINKLDIDKPSTNDSYNQFIEKCKEYNGTQLRCEVVKNQIHIFDILTYKSSNEPIQSFRDKLKFCTELYQMFHQYYSTLNDPPFQFFLKEFYNTKEIENDIRQVCQSMYAGASKNINKI